MAFLIPEAFQLQPADSSEVWYVSCTSTPLPSPYRCLRCKLLNSSAGPWFWQEATPVSLSLCKITHNDGGWTLTRRTCPVQCCLREKKNHRYSKMIPWQACKCPTNCTFERTQPILRDRNILLRAEKMDWKDALKATFVVLLKTGSQIADEKQTNLSRYQTMAREWRSIASASLHGLFHHKIWCPSAWTLSVFPCTHLLHAYIHLHVH